MTTKAANLNATLVLLGQPPVSGASDTRACVRTLVGNYNAVVRLMLEDHPWNFATELAQLEQVAWSEPVGREYKYNKPADFLRITQVNNTGESADNEIPDYDDRGGNIYADMDPLFMFYVSSTWITKEGAWPEKFARAVQTEHAAFNAELATKQIQKGMKLEKGAKIALQKAKSFDASQKPFKEMPGGRWAAARRAGGVRYRTNG